MTAVWLYTLVPVGIAVLGAAVAVNVRPGPTLVSAIQHFAAGAKAGLSRCSSSRWR